MTIGENIKNQRLKANISQKALADKLQITQSMVCQIERGSKIPSILLGRGIAEALGCSIDDLMKN